MGLHSKLGRKIFSTKTATLSNNAVHVHIIKNKQQLITANKNGGVFSIKLDESTDVSNDA